MSTPSIPPRSESALLAEGLPLVQRLAGRMSRRLPKHILADDLTSAGAVGLMKAVRSFDRARGHDFEAYASFRIRGAMLDELRALDPLSRYARARTKSVARAARALEQERGRPAELHEVAAATGLAASRCRAILDDGVRGSAFRDAGETDPDDLESGRPDAADLLAEREQAVRLSRAIATLPERTQRVLTMYFEEGLSQADIGRELGVTDSRVCQILREAIHTLRARMSVH